MTVLVNDSEIILAGTVGGDSWWFEDGFGASDVIAALARIGRDKEVTVRLNSPGGIATEGAAIHAALAGHKGGVNVIVEGVAASAASLIAMAGKKRSMSPGATMMIHDVSSITMGNAAEHQKTIEMLNAVSDAYASVYAERSGKTVEEARALMQATTWMTADQAVEMGFADEKLARADSESEPEPAAFAYGMYAKAPAHLVALANARGWRPRASMAALAASTRPKENPMTEKTEAATTAAGDNKQTETTAATTTATAAAAAAATATASVEDAAEIASICAGFGMKTEQITAFIKSGGTVEKAKARAADVVEIRAMAASAEKAKPGSVDAALADELVASGVSAAEARKTIFDKMVAHQSAELDAHVSTGATTSDASVWDKIVPEANARRKAAFGSR